MVHPPFLAFSYYTPIYRSCLESTTKQKIPSSKLEGTFVNHNYLTASLRALPALNAGTLEALILIALPVCGLRPLRAAR